MCHHGSMQPPQKSLFQRFQAPLFFGLVSLVILGPLLLPGYVLSLDMLWTPELPQPDWNDSRAFVTALIYVLGLLLPSMIVQKIVLFSIFWLAGYGMFRLTRTIVTHTKMSLNRLSLSLYAAGLFYVCNPFVYERFMDGQWYVLLGYALLPWVAERIITFIQHQTFRNGIWVTIVSFFAIAASVHNLYMVALLYGALFAAAIWQQRAAPKKLVRLIAGGLAGFLISLIMGIGPMLANGAAVSSEVARFDGRDLLSFRTVATGPIPPAVSPLVLHGYWGEAQNRFLVHATDQPGWLILMASLGVCVVYGAIALWTRSRSITLALLACIGSAAILAVGIAAPGFQQLTTLLLEKVLPILRLLYRNSAINAPAEREYSLVSMLKFSRQNRPYCHHQQK